jgi:hypothetical protein
MILDYVSSGNSSIKIFRDSTMEMSKENIDAARAMFKGISRDHRRYSALFNAYTEPAIGIAIHNHFKDVVSSSHADSGGLQMMTLGKSVTEAEKMKIYETQGKYSDIAMCFDEIPIATAGGKTGMTDMSGRYFDHALVKEKATATGVNLRNQINKFRDMGSKAKPMLIMQGNCLPSYQEWVNYACDAVGADLLGDVYGISVAGTSLGGGMLESVVKAAASTILTFPSELNSKKIHLLGVGSPSRFLPYIPFKDKLEDCHVSFDSTTHTHATFKGVIVDGLKTMKWDTLRMGEKEYLIREINNTIARSTDFRVTMNDVASVYGGSVEYEKVTGLKGAHCDHFIASTVAIMTFMVERCLDSIDEMFKGGKIYTTVAAERGGVGAFNAIKGVNSIKDFDEWHVKFAKYLKSDKVQSSREVPLSLDEFF